jgi:hypothetical protein
MMIGYDVYDRFSLRQRLTLTTKIYCSNVGNLINKMTT